MICLLKRFHWHVARIITSACLNTSNKSSLSSLSLPDNSSYFFSHLKSLSLLLLVLLLLQTIVREQSRERLTGQRVIVPGTNSPFWPQRGSAWTRVWRPVIESHITGGRSPMCEAGAEDLAGGEGCVCRHLPFAWKVSKNPEMLLTSQRIICKAKHGMGV